jgi:hypothetical protein
LSSSSTNLSRPLRGSAARVFGFMSTRNRRKLSAPSAMQTHEPKTNVVPCEGTDLMKLKDAIELAGGSSTRQLSVFNRLPTEGYTQGGKFWARRRRDQELEGARNTRLRQVRAARSVTPYVLYGLYCLWCKMT